MSVMCTKDACVAKSGMCGHEKMMMGILMLMGVAAAGHWAFHWF